ncbi:MAG: beta-ketoacyl-ACP synthase [Gammaproteobacteria bacterium]|nr:beta-ketoacyl-ACP synthase [Gammaproteobacteria bacterium]
MTDRPICYLHNLGILSAVGHGKAAVWAGLMRADTSGMVLTSDWHATKSSRVGRVAAPLPDIADSLSAYRCRANALLLAAADEIRADIDAAIARFGRDRVGIVIGTSTSGIAEGEAAISALANGEPLSAFHYGQQEIGGPAPFLAAALNIDGPAYVVSTACTSSAKALACARHLLWSGLCDAVIAGGADSLCRLTVGGFGSLELTTSELCNPLSRNRRGINIGEGAALFLISREPGPVALLGVGESSDAHHISAPDPEGKGAELSLRAALADAALQPTQVDYINLHGTATPQNDFMEAWAVSRVFGMQVPCSSTKPFTGHTLGAAGAIEAGFCWLALSGYNTAHAAPPHIWDGVADPQLPPITLADTTTRLPQRRPRIMVSNSFAFGGNNISLVLSDRS